MRKLITSAVVAATFAGSTVEAAPPAFAFGFRSQATEQTAPAEPTAEKKPSRFPWLWSRATKPANTVNIATPSLPQLAASQPASQPTVAAATNPQGQVAPPTSDVLISLANAAEAEGKFDVAREHLRRAVGVAPSDSKTLRAAGRFEDRRGELATAEALYQRAVVSDPKSAAAANDLAICLARQGKMEDSANAFTKAIQLNPAKKLYRNNIAKVLLELGEQEAALGNLVTVHGQATGHYNLGYLMSARGDKEGATKQYQLALAADPALEAARSALAALTPPTQEALVATSLPPAPVEAPKPYAVVPLAPTQPGVAPYASPAPGVPAVASPGFPQATQQR